MNQRLFADFSEQPIGTRALRNIRDFVTKYVTPAGRGELLDTGLNAQQVDAVLSRARHLATTGRFPRATTMDDLRKGFAK